MSIGETPDDERGTIEPQSAESDREDKLTWSILDGQFNPALSQPNADEIDRIANSTLSHPEDTKTKIQVFLVLKNAFALSGNDISVDSKTAAEIRTYILEAAAFCIEFFPDEYMHTEEGLGLLTPELDEQPPAVMQALDVVLQADRDRYARAVDEATALTRQEGKDNPDKVETAPIKGDARRFSRAIIRIRSLEEKGLSRDEIRQALKALAAVKHNNIQ